MLTTTWKCVFRLNKIETALLVEPVCPPEPASCKKKKRERELGLKFFFSADSDINTGIPLVNSKDFQE